MWSQIPYLDLLEVAIPARCLVCDRRLRRSLICTHCDITKLPTNNTHRCSKCYTPLVTTDFLCLLCQHYGLPLNSIRYIWNYEGIVREYVSTMKYNPSRHLTNRLTDFIYWDEGSSLKTTTWDHIVPIPASAQSLHRRGFNQCQILAEGISQKFQTTLTINALSHLGVKFPQVSLHTKKRIKNVLHAFQAYPEITQGKRILLIDDVITTGATSAAAAQALYRAGALEVDILALARSPSWIESRFEISRTYESR